MSHFIHPGRLSSYTSVETEIIYTLRIFTIKKMNLTSVNMQFNKF